MLERVTNPNQPTLGGVDYSAAVELTCSIAANIRRKRKTLTSHYDEDPSIAGCDATGRYDFSAQWGQNINELKTGLLRSGDVTALGRVNKLIDPIYINYMRQTAHGDYKALGLLVDSDGTIVDQYGVPITEETLQPLHDHVDTFSSVAKRSIHEAISRVRTRAEIRSAGMQPSFGNPENLFLNQEAFFASLETPFAEPSKHLTETLLSHDLLPRHRVQISRNAHVSFSRPFALSHANGTRPAFMSYGSTSNSNARYPGIIYLDPAGSWRQIVETRPTKNDQWYSLNNQFHGTTLPYQLQRNASQFLHKDGLGITADITHSLRLLRGSIKQRGYASVDSWTTTSQHLEIEPAVINNNLNGFSSPNFSANPVSTYPLHMPEEFPDQTLACEVIPSFDGLFYYTFARTADSKTSWLVNVDYPFGMVRLPVGNRVSVTHIVDESGSNAVLTGTPEESSKHPLSIKFLEYRADQERASSYAKFRKSKKNDAQASRR